MSLREQEVEKKEEVEEEEPQNPYPETNRDGMPVAPNEGVKAEEQPIVKISRVEIPLVKKQVKLEQDSAYETRWDSQHYNDDVKRSSRGPSQIKKDACCSLM